MFLKNSYIFVPLVAWFLAQWIKFTIAAFRGEINFRYLYASGGMPSVHSAVVCALFGTTWLLQGSMSPLFGITGILAMIVMYDSLGVRRSTGEQAVVLNTLVDTLEQQKVTFASPVSKVREVLGHQPKEVFWGAILGFVVAGLANFDKLSKQVDWLTAMPAKPEQLGYLLLTLAVTIGIVAILFGTRKRWRKADSQSGKLLLWLAVAVCLAALFVSLAQYEAVNVLGARWVLFALYALLAVMVGYSYHLVRALPKATKQAESTDRKDRWLKKEKTKKRKR